MCELFCLSNRVPTRASVSLHRFASHVAPEGGSVDGWGLALYDGRDVRLYKEPEPAGNSPWLAFVEYHQVATSILVSHIRRATQGEISLGNTQPLIRELGGRAHVFAHNGNLHGIREQCGGQRHRFQPIGSTDSEAAFCLLLECLLPLWNDNFEPSIHERFSTLSKFASEIRELGPANFIYSDGNAVFAHGHRRIQNTGDIAPPGLWRLQRECALDADALPQAGVTLDSEGSAQDITLLASVPLTDETWVPFAEGEVAAISNGRLIEVNS